MAKYVNVRLKLCQGCLSADRSLLDLDEYESKIFYSFTKIVSFISIYVLHNNKNHT